jgi:hypothetical protein
MLLDKNVRTFLVRCTSNGRTRGSSAHATTGLSTPKPETSCTVRRRDRSIRLNSKCAKVERFGQSVDKRAAARNSLEPNEDINRQNKIGPREESCGQRPNRRCSSAVDPSHHDQCRATVDARCYRGRRPCASFLGITTSRGGLWNLLPDYTDTDLLVAPRLATFD